MFQLNRSHCVCLYSLRACKRERARALNATSIITNCVNCDNCSPQREESAGNVLSWKRDHFEQIK